MGLGARADQQKRPPKKWPKSTNGDEVDVSAPEAAPADLSGLRWIEPFFRDADHRQGGHEKLALVALGGLARTVCSRFWSTASVSDQARLFNALSERDGADSAVKDVFSLSEGKPV